MHGRKKVTKSKLAEKDDSPVMFCSFLKITKEYTGISKVAIGSPLCRAVSKLFSDEQTLKNKFTQQCKGFCQILLWYIHTL